MKLLTRLYCAACGLEHAVDRLQNLCGGCGKPLLAGYDLAGLKGRFTVEAVRAGVGGGSRPRSMWRFYEVLPVDGPAEAVSLGEGATPLLETRQRGSFEDWESVWIKDESLNPTGSFKSRGMSAAVTRAAALGVKEVALPSAGNAGGAAAAYAARAGIRCWVFMPVDTPPANVAEAVAAGARVYLVKGLISDCGKLVRDGCERAGWFDLSTLKEPFRIEGKKTMGYELAFDLADALGGGRPRLPDCVIYPTGGGTGLIGMWKAFDEMEALGWIGSERPRMVVAQAAGCAPIVRAWEAGAESAEPVRDAHTVAAGLRVPGAIGDFIMLRVLRETGGTAVAVTDEELLAGQHELTTQQGVFAAPESGATWAAAKKLREQGWLKRDESVVLFNTASGVKYTHLMEPAVPVVDLDEVDWEMILGE